MKKLVAAAVVAFAAWWVTPVLQNAYHMGWYGVGAWVDACRLTEYSCINVRPPAVVYSERGPGGALGWYWPGTNTVYISGRLNYDTSLRDYGVLVHEMVHYLQDQHSAYGSSQLGRCMAEGEAWRVFNDLMRAHDAEDKAVDRWWTRYAPCGAP